MSCARHRDLRLQARALRMAGRSTFQIARALAIERVPWRWLVGIPAPTWTSRPNAKDHLREVAHAMRLEGKSYRDILEVVPVSKGTLSLWLRDIPITEEHARALEDRRRAAGQRRADTLHAKRVQHEQRLLSESAAEIGHLSDRELFLLGVILYWAEGTKGKPWRENKGVIIVNSDPGLIRLFLAWLRLLGIEKERLTFRLAIHETADEGEAIAFWSQIVGVPPSSFLRTQLKSHRPLTNRKNTGASYRGCLIIRVRRGTDLYRRIAGWYEGILEGVDMMARGVIGSTGGFGPPSSGSSPDGPATVSEGRTSYGARAS